MRKPSRTVNEAGFTLIEMLVVLVIVVVAATIAYPILSRSDGAISLRATAHQIASQLRSARAGAIRSNRDHTLTIDIGARRYWVDGLTKPRAIPAAIGVDFVTLQQEQLSSTRARLRFHPDGSATGGNIILSAGGRRAVVEVDWLTGNSRVIWRK